MKKFAISLAIMLAAAGAAHAADLPTTKAPATPPPANCFSSLWAYLNATAADCPLSYAGVTVYATLDYGVGYESHGAGYNAAFNNGVSNIVTKQSGFHSQWLQTPNGLSQSVVGVKVSEPLWYGWSLVGAVETGFNPYFSYLADAQRSQIHNNGKALVLQNANADSSRTGQWDNSQGFIGLSNKTFGTLVVGRVNTLSLDGINAYDPMGGSYAFSPLGYSGSYAGFGNTEAARANTAVKYRVDYMNFRGAGLVQWGGYNQGNGTDGLYQGQLGGDLKFPTGTLSLDGIVSYAKDAVNVGTFSGACATLTKGPYKGLVGCSNGIPVGYNSSDVTATLSNNTGVMLLAKYKWQAFTFFGGYEYIKQANPSDDYLNGFSTIGYWNVPATIPGLPKGFTTQWTSYNAYNYNRIANVVWTGVKYAVTPDLDVTGAFYYLEQNNYNFSYNATTGVTTPAACTTANTNYVTPTGTYTVTRINSGKCAGSTDFISFLLDWRPVKRVDLYAGVMISNVYAGLANGYQVTQTVNPTAGLRIKF